jgi:hypothetical protein
VRHKQLFFSLAGGHIQIMDIVLTINAKSSDAKGKFGAKAGTLAALMEGRKSWVALSHFRFETTEANIRAFKDHFPDCVVADERDLAEQFDIAASPDVPEAVMLDGNYPFILPPRDFQLENFHKFKDLPQFAIFSEQGTGKTKVMYDIISYRFMRKTVDAVIILSSPKGVHAQWIEEQLPKHLWPCVPFMASFWNGKIVPFWVGMKTPGSLQIFSANIDAVIHERSCEPLEMLMQLHGPRLMVVVDESDSIKNATSRRNKELRRLCDKYRVQQRAIMTGTPIAKDLTDEWAQFLFLNPAIIGHKYKTAFQAQYCRMGGFENRSVVGHRNVQAFKDLTAPYIFRATKSQLNLPEKVYDEIVFDLTPEQKKHTKTLKEAFLAQLDGGEIVSVANAAAMMVRLQQLSCGYLVDEDGTYHDLEVNPRMDAIKRLRASVGGKIIIWARFNRDIEHVTEAMGRSAVSYYGGTSTDDRVKAKERFMNDPDCTELVANPQAAGKGVDGLQHVCTVAAYYSNSYNAIDRWQSEDRIHRIGQSGTATYFDLVARGSVDRAILANLRQKKGLSQMVLDDVKRIVEAL